jgi:hypothetical protein
MRLKRDEHERRAKFRFPLRRELRYKILEDQEVIQSGLGESIDMSSAGVAFQTERDLKAGAAVEVSISWPVLLDDSCPMRLVALGQVLRCNGGIAVCSIDKYEFRTQARVHTLAPPRSDSTLHRWAEDLKLRAATA